MYKWLKIIAAIMLSFSLIVFTSCGNDMLAHHQEIQNVAEQAMEHFVNKDIDSLMLMFSTDIQEIRKEETIEEIEESYEFLDGEIVSYSYNKERGGQRKIRDGEIVYYNCYPEFKIVTSNEVSYVMRFSYHYIWNEKPERVGICKIRIHLEDYSDDAVAGIVYND